MRGNIGSGGDRRGTTSAQAPQAKATEIKQRLLNGAPEQGDLAAPIDGDASPVTVAPRHTPEEVDAEWQRLTLATEDRQREAWEATKNPLFIWQCISILGYDAVAQSALKSERRLPCPERRAFPEWITKYLELVSWRIGELRNGRDWRLFPDVTGDPAADNALLNEYQSKGNLTPASAADLLPLSLGFTRNGWNAFSAFETTTDAYHANDMVAFFRTEWGSRPSMKPGEAMRQVMKDLSFEDERSFRRFLNKGKFAAHRGKRVKPKRQD